MLFFNRLMGKIAQHHKLSLLSIALISVAVAYLDYLSPPEVPVDILYAIPICLGLMTFGRVGGFAVVVSSSLLFYVSNYLLGNNNITHLWLALLLTSSLFGIFTYGAYHFLLNARHLKQVRLDLQARVEELSETRSDLQVRIEELNQLYEQSQLLYKQNLKLAVIEERNRLAREIHDVLAQGMLAIIVQVEAAHLSQSDVAALEARLAQIDELARYNLQEARRSVENLRPLPLDGKSLKEALEHKIQDFVAQYHIETLFNSSGQEQALPGETEEALYRITQEALTNVTRHSKASQVQITLDYDEDEVCLTIQDNGQGFEIVPRSTNLEGENKTRPAFGLKTMQERGRLVGGWVTIQSRFNEGCRIRVIVPSNIVGALNQDVIGLLI